MGKFPSLVEIYFSSSVFLHGSSALRIFWLVFTIGLVCLFFSIFPSWCVGGFQVDVVQVAITQIFDGGC